MNTEAISTEPVSGQQSAVSAVTVELCRDADVLDAILHHPDVGERTRHDTMPPLAEMTLKPLLETNPSASAVLARVRGVPAGFWLVLAKGAGVFEIHTNFLPQYRGAKALVASRLALDWMFLNTPATRLTSFVPGCLPEVAAYAAWCGLKTDFIRPAAWPKGGQRHDVAHVSLTVEEWARSAWPRYAEEGEAFHQELFSHVDDGHHEDDDNHNGMVGLAGKMLMAGFGHKAQAFYNEWAAQAGYAPFLYLGPRRGWQLLDIATSILAVRRESDGQIRVISFQPH
jgi:hypothetical protein